METINIPVLFKGENLNFEAQLVQYGYIYKILVHINEVAVQYERDEEGYFRALIDPQNNKAQQVDIAMVKAIGEVLETTRS